MNFPTRLRHTCQPTKKDSGRLGTVPPSFDLALPDPGEEANVALLTGVIIEDPIQDTSRGGEPVTVLLVAFGAPDDKTRRATSCCEVEVPDEIADQQRGQLRVGERIVVLGRLSGAGGLWATAIVTRESPIADD